MFLDDGYTLDAVVAAQEDAPAFEVTYRPMLQGERHRLVIGTLRAEESGDNARMIEWEERVARAVADKVKQWTLRDRTGGSVKVSAEAIKRMDPVQFGELYNLVGGWVKPDKYGKTPAEADAKN